MCVHYHPPSARCETMTSHSFHRHRFGSHVPCVLFLVRSRGQGPFLMRRRTRPLEPGEYDAVKSTEQLQVEFLLETEDYCLKWPDSPLARRIRRSQGITTTKASAATTDFAVQNLVSTVKITPISLVLKLYTSPSSVCRSDADIPRYTLDEQCIKDLELRMHRGLRPADEARIEEHLSLLERRAWEHYRQLPKHTRHVSEMQMCVHCPDGVEPVVYEWWVGARKATASVNHPWGVPLIAEYFEGSIEDEYFIPSNTQMSNDTELKAAERGPSKMAYFTPRRRRPQAAKHPWYLPYDHPEVDTSVAAGRDVEAARSLFDGVRLEDLKFREVVWAVNDLDAELAECASWLSVN